MTNIFTKHPNSVGESYLVHGAKAVGYSVQMLFASICCIVHAVFPFVFKSTASNIARKVVGDVENRIENGNSE